MLGADENGARLTLWDEAGEVRAVLGADKSGPALALVDKAGKLRLTLQRKPAGSPSLHLSDQDGTVIWRAPQ